MKSNRIARPLSMSVTSPLTTILLSFLVTLQAFSSAFFICHDLHADEKVMSIELILGRLRSVLT